MKVLLIAGLFVSADLFGQGAGVLTLEQALQSALVHNLSLQIASERAAGDQAKADEVHARLFPELSFAGGYSRIEDGAFRLSTTNLPAPIQVGYAVVNNYTIRVGLRQPLFTGFRLSRQADAASLQATATGFERSMTEQDVVYEVTSAYWTLYQYQKIAELDRLNVRRLESYVEDTIRLLQAGMATQNDRLRVEVQLSNARISEIEAQKNVSLATMDLNRSMGQPVSTLIVLGSVPAAEGDSLLSVSEELDTLVALASNRRPDLQAATIQAEAAEASVDAVEGEWWPQVDLTANYQYNNPNSRYQPITPEFLGTWDVGVSLFFNLWNWGETGSRVEQAEAMHRQAEIRIHQMMDNIAIDISRARLNLIRSRDKIKFANLAVSQANENLRSTSDRYRSGIATSSELLDAEVDVTQTETLLSAAKVEYELAKADLHRAMGEHLPVGKNPE